jgi:hypothetical protein
MISPVSARFPRQPRRSETDVDLLEAHLDPFDQGSEDCTAGLRVWVAAGKQQVDRASVTRQRQD